MGRALGSEIRKRRTNPPRPGRVDTPRGGERGRWRGESEGPSNFSTPGPKSESAERTHRVGRGLTRLGAWDEKSRRRRPGLLPTTLHAPRPTFPPDGPRVREKRPCPRGRRADKISGLEGSGNPSKQTT